MGRWIEDYFRQLFDNRVVDEMLRQKLWKHYYDILAGGVDKGFSNFGNLTIDSSELVASLKMDIARFSAFKEESFKNELLKQLQGKELPTWTDFKESAAKVDAEYNQRHLQTEYHQTVANAQAAAQWKDYESRKHLYPNLRYQAVMDGRTRETHARWNGLVLPLEHDFWKTNYPPNDWGCRCSVVQVDDEVDDSKLAQTGNSLTKAAFQNNPGISGKVFDGNAYSIGLNPEKIELIGIKAAQWVAQNTKGITKRLANDLIYSLPVNKQFEVLGKFGEGRVLRHWLAEKGNDYNSLINIAKHFAKQGKTVMLLPKPVKNNAWSKFYKKLGLMPYYGKNPDLLIDGVFYEHEGFEKIDNALRNMFNKGLKQSSRLIIEDEGSTINYIKRRISQRLTNGQKIDEVWVLDKKGNMNQVY